MWLIYFLFIYLFKIYTSFFSFFSEDLIFQCMKYEISVYYTHPGIFIYLYARFNNCHIYILIKMIFPLLKGTNMFILIIGNNLNPSQYLNGQVLRSILLHGQTRTFPNDPLMAKDSVIYTLIKIRTFAEKIYN